MSRVKLSDHISTLFSSFNQLFSFALTRDVQKFEAEFLKYFSIKQDSEKNLQNCL